MSGPSGLPSGSTAIEAFVESTAVLHAYAPSAPRRAPAYTYVPVAGPPCPPLRPTDDARAGDVATGLIPAARERLASGEQSAVELLEECALAVDKRDAELVGFAELRLDLAREAAAHADRVQSAGGSLGALHGIPISVKDVIDVAGMTTRCGSVAYHDVPSVDAESVARLRRAGAVIVGKATTHEFALGVTSPQSRNPHDPSRIPGGSSGGSAITVATGMALASVGTDTRASIRVPAALSGVVGVKPTFATVPTAGVVPLSWTMDHVGPLATSVVDAAIVLDLLAGVDGGYSRWTHAAVAGTRVGVGGASFDGCEPAVAAAVATAIETLVVLGCRTVDVDGPTARDLDQANAAGLVVSRCEAATFHRTINGELARYWPEVGGQLSAAGDVRALDYIDAQRLRADLGTRLLAQFELADVLVMPTVPVVAPSVTDFARYLMVLSRNAIPWSFLGYPVVSVPCGTDAQGLPIGLQVVGPPGHDGPVLSVAAAFERAHRV